MAVGIISYLCNAFLNAIRGGGSGTSYTAPAAVYVQLHTANPGAAGSTAVSSVTTRSAATFGAAASGVISLTNTPSWASWAGTNGEVVSHISCWDASSAGNCLWTAALTVAKTMNTGDTLNLTAATVTITPAS